MATTGWNLKVTRGGANRLPHFWQFDFRHKFESGTTATDAAMKTNQYWWHQQNEAIGQDGRQTPNCWLPAITTGNVNRSSEGRMTMGRYSKGDHVKIEAVNENSGESEWMWLLVERSDDVNRLVFGRLDSEPIGVTDMRLGQELAVSYDNVREHRRFD
jgi:hypothetical protein